MRFQNYEYVACDLTTEIQHVIVLWIQLIQVIQMTELWIDLDLGSLIIKDQYGSLDFDTKFDPTKTDEDE